MVVSQPRGAEALISISQPQPRTTEVNVEGTGVRKRYRAPEPPLQRVEFRDYYAEDPYKTDTHLTPGNRYLTLAAHLDRRERISIHSSSPT